MTVSNIYTPLRTQGNGTSINFDFSFKTVQNVETGEVAIKVVIRDDLTGVEHIKVQGIDYTVVIEDVGGTVTFTIAPLLTEFITVLLDIPKTQNTDYINIGTDKFPADSHEGTSDKTILVTQQLGEESIRAISLPESSTLTELTIPVNVANADNIITVNSAGDNFTAVKAGDIDLIKILFKMI